MKTINSKLILSNIWEKNAKAYINGYRNIINKGGTSSTKTFSILQLLIEIARKHPIKIDVVSQTTLHLRSGVLEDMIHICKQYGIVFENHYQKSAKIFKWGKGTINFLSFDKLGKAHGGRRGILFLNEANHIPYIIVQQLMIRTKKCIFIDYNPTGKFWIKKVLKEEKDSSIVIKSTYKDNPRLEQSIIDSIEKRRGDNNFWRVYGLGEDGIAEGLIFNNFKKLDFDKNRFAKYYNGLDWGFSCLKGDTLVSTDKGNVEIKDIKVGDRVLTREGYKKVIFTKNTGFKEVYRLDFGYKKSIIVTGDHRIYTTNGWKRVDELKDREELCLKRLSLVGKFIKGILRVNTLTIFIIKKIKKQIYCTEIFGKILTERLKKVISYIILIAILLTIILKTLFVLLPQSIVKYIIKKSLALFQKKRCTIFVEKMDIQNKTGKKERLNLWQLLEREYKIAKSVEKKLKFQMFIKSTAVLNVVKKLIQEKVKKNINVKIAGIYLWLHRITKETLVQKNVRINLRLLKEKEEVFDISVENREFFANGLLVHNCDPFAFVRFAIEQNNLYICQEIYQKGLLNSDSAPLVKEIIGRDSVICDCAEPKSIKEYRKDYHINAIACKKGSGSIETGIKKLQEFDNIYIHPDCPCTLEEFENYEWLKNRNEIQQRKPIDAWNHIIDGLRYANENRRNKKKLRARTA